jgi:L-galactose dehydrogenase
MGILTERGAEDWHPAPAEVHELGRRIREHVRSRGADVTEVALLFAIAHPHVATTCVGMRSDHEVDQNVATLRRQLDPELLAEIEELAAPVRGTTWVQGYPEYNDPGSVGSSRSDEEDRSGQS